MAKVVDKLKFAYKKGEYGKFLKKIGHQWKESDFLQDEEKLSMYVFSCYHEEKPRKLGEILKRMCNSAGESEVIIELLKVALIDRRDAVIESIAKISAEYGDSRIALSVNIKIIEAIISRKSTIKYFTTKRTGELISETLNQEDFYSFEESEGVLLKLKNRARKLYREKNYERVISWFEDVECRDENFNSYRFILLSFRGSKDIERCRDLSREALRKLELPENIEVVLDILYTISDFPGIVSGFSGNEIESMSFKGRFILARTLRKIGEVGKVGEMGIWEVESWGS